MCGILGVVATSPVNQLLYDGLQVLQHRGQDAAGIATSEGGRFHLHKGSGLVRDVFRGMWDARGQRPPQERGGWLEIRPMRIPHGAQPERLRMAAWVQGDGGDWVGTAHTYCGTGH